MKFSDFTKDLRPDRAINNFLDLMKAPFEKRADQPWAQGTARNMAHALIPEAFADKIDQKVWGDYPGGFRHYQGPPSTQPTGVAPLTEQQTVNMMQWLQSLSNR